jgi:hypothetical protein
MPKRKIGCRYSAPQLSLKAFRRKTLQILWKGGYIYRRFMETFPLSRETGFELPKSEYQAV